MKTLKLEVGKIYRSRNGSEVKIVRKSNGGRCPCCGNNGKWYTESGRWNRHSKGEPDDLIEEVTETRHTFAIPDGVKEITLEQVGNRIVVEMVPEATPKPEMLKEGDVVFEDGRIMIVKMHPNFYHTLFYPKNGKLYINDQYGIPFTSAAFRLATPEEAQPLFDALKKAGKRWNAETMEVEDVPESTRILEWVEETYKYGYYNQKDIAEVIGRYLKHKEGKK